MTAPSGVLPRKDIDEHLQQADLSEMRPGDKRQRARMDESQAEARTRGEEGPGLAESLKPSGLDLPDEFTFQEWADLGGMIGGVVRNRQWWTGDWVLAGERFGERYSQHIDSLGYTYESLANCVSICRRFHSGMRNVHLSFKHHAVVAKLDDKEARNWLTQAEDQGWSTSKFREAVWGRKPKAVRFTIEELWERLSEWPGDLSVRNNGRKFAEAFLAWLAAE